MQCFKVYTKQLEDVIRQDPKDQDLNMLVIVVG